MSSASTPQRSVANPAMGGIPTMGGVAATKKRKRSMRRDQDEQSGGGNGCFGMCFAPAVGTSKKKGSNSIKQIAK